MSSLAGLDIYDQRTGSLWYPYRKGLMGIQGKFFEKWLPKKKIPKIPHGIIG